MTTTGRRVPDDAVTQPITGGPAGAVDVAARPPRGSTERRPHVTERPRHEAVADAVRRDPRFRELRTRQRRFVFTATPLFLAWYGLFVGLSAFAPSLMAVPVLGAVNAGMLLGLAQFASTLAIVAAYRRFARREIDPRVRDLRAVYAAGSSDAHAEIRSLR
ncbi:DUF485 domain-containing protein [Pseudonocardia endophytica]|uniref:Uncharacterized membrane protein (DUF485 family) n=1 Tax=Pseudonocardia endophytica TaxID=401976 RepID=A0A4R1HN25_PSEEN|nr:DUF485 domain-containing protein [Pseudonocardia endophytica]TCK22473.1 uncharacterized membrane protein (DUF485 family) [Pseudonocardia endophytica]